MVDGYKPRSNWYHDQEERPYAPEELHQQLTELIAETRRVHETYFVSDDTKLYLDEGLFPGFVRHLRNTNDSLVRRAYDDLLHDSFHGMFGELEWYRRHVVVEGISLKWLRLSERFAANGVAFTA